MDLRSSLVILLRKTPFSLSPFLLAPLLVSLLTNFPTLHLFFPKRFLVTNITQRRLSLIHSDNFVVIYELLDEMMDFGYPQTTEVKILQEYITQESHQLEAVKPPMAVTNAVSWRSEGMI